MLTLVWIHALLIASFSSIVRAGQPKVGDNVAATLIGTVDTFCDSTNAATSFTFPNPQFGICYSLLVNNANVDMGSVFTNATYTCEEGMQPSVIFYTADFGCKDTVKDMDSGYIVTNLCNNRAGQSTFKAFKLGCTLSGLN